MKISNLMGILVLGLVGASFAANPFTVDCETSSSESQETGGSGSLTCTISQSADLKDEGSYVDWSTLVTYVNDQIKENPAIVSAVEIVLGTDITFDAITLKDNGVPSCGEATAFNLSVAMDAVVNFSFDGGNHTVKNFCSVGSDGASIGFISSISNGTVKDVTFDSAFVMSRPTTTGTEASVAVVAVSAENVAFENIKISNSKVYGMNVGSVAQTVSNGSFSNITVANTDVGTPAEVFPDFSGPAEVFPDFSGMSGSPDATCASSTMGGMVATALDIKSFSGITMTEVSVGVNNASTVAYGTDNANSANVYNRTIGGVVGQLSTGNDELTYMGGSVDVSVGKGGKMGGLFGSVEGLSDITISGATVDAVLTHPNCEGDRMQMGGLMGYISSSSRTLKIERNTISISGTIDFSECSETYLSGIYTGGMLGAEDFTSIVDSLNVITQNSWTVGNEKMEGYSWYIGGLYGSVTSGLRIQEDKIEKTEINVLGELSGDFYLGGLVGKFEGYGDSFQAISDTIASGTITAGVSISEDYSHAYMGGALGYGLSNNSNVNVNGNSFQIALNVNKNASGKYLIGGACGDVEGNTEIDLYDNVFKTSITDSSSALSDSVYMAGLVAKREGASGDAYIYRNEVSGTLKTSRSVVAAGGLIASSTPSGGTSGKLYLFNNSCNGDIDVTSGQSGVGFLVGNLQMDTVMISGNYHVGSTDANAAFAIGNFTNVNNEAVAWGSVSDTADISNADTINVCFNYRNAVDGLSATTGEWRSASGWLYDATAKSYTLNGVLAESYMQSYAFASNLNVGLSRVRPYNAGHDLVFYDSWGSDNKSYPHLVDYGESDYIEYPTYRVVVDYGNVESSLSKTYKTDMSAYMVSGTTNEFTTYSMGNGKLTEDFLTAYENLGSEFGVIVDSLNNGSRYPSKISSMRKITSTRTYFMYGNTKFSFKYGTSGTTAFSEFDGSEIYLTPRVESAGIFDDDLIPLIRSNDDAYVAVKYILKCSEKALSANACQSDYTSSERYAAKLGAPTFADLLAEIVLYVDDLSLYEDTIQLVYSTDISLPSVVMRSADTLNYMMVFGETSGYKKDNESVIIVADTAKSSSASFETYGSMVSFYTSKGFSATGYDVDLWVNFSYDYEDFSSCYGDSPKDLCSYIVAERKADLNVGTVDGLVDSLMMGDAKKLWKFSMSLSAKDSIDLKNLTQALASVVANGFDNPGIYLHVTPKGAAIDYTITFIPNESNGKVDVGEDVFFADDWSESGSFSLENSTLPKLYSVDNKFKGWSAVDGSAPNEKDESGNEITSSSMAFENVSTQFLDTVGTDKDTLVVYGSWEKTSTGNYRTLTLVADTSMETPSDEGSKVVPLHGTVALVQSYVLNGKTIEKIHEFAEDVSIDEGSYSMATAILKVPANTDTSMTFRVTSVPDAGYKLSFLSEDIATSVPVLWAPASTDVYGLTMSATDTTFRMNNNKNTVYTLTARFTPVPYTITFNRETTPEWFYTKDWRDTAIYTIDSFADFQSAFPGMYSANGYAKGWYVEKNAENFGDCGPTFDHVTYCLEGGTYTENDTLYMVLEKEKPENASVTIDSDVVDVVRLVQFIGNKDDGFGVDSISHSFALGDTSGELLMPIPSYIADYLFTVRLSPMDGYAVDSLAVSYDVLSETAELKDTVYRKDGDTLSINLNEMQNIRFAPVMRMKNYEVVFENPVTEDVIVDGENVEKKSFSVDSSDFSYPSGIYTTERCVVGWSNSASDSLKYSDENSGMAYFDWRTADALTEGSDTLTAVWADGATCDNETSKTDSVEGGYSRVVLDAENGTVELIQMTTDKDGNATQVRTRAFGSGMYMLFPLETSGDSYYIVSIQAMPGYVAPDSVLFYYDKDRVNADAIDGLDSIWLADGDTLPAFLTGSVLKADFVRLNNELLEFASTTSFDTTGNAFYLNMDVNGLYEGREAHLDVYLMNAMGNVVDSSMNMVDSLHANVSWLKYPLASGSYVIKANLWDLHDSTSFDTTFTVSNYIEAASMDGWQMINLSVVDKKSVDWNDTDAVFYWWNESSSVGEYWQYQSYGEADSVGNVTGGWYSSLAGAALEIRDDVEFPDSSVWTLENEFSGWNLVANPYNWTIVNPALSLESYRWNTDSADYVPDPSVLKPYEAIWVRVDTLTKIRLDDKPVFVTRADETAEVEKSLEKRKALAKVVGEDNWTIRAVLKDEKGRMDAWNVLGVGENARVGEPPQSMADHVNLSIVDGKIRLAKSVLQSSEEGYTWNLEVSATTNRRGFLNFEGLDRVAALGYRLFVTVDDRTVELTGDESMPVALKSLSKSVKVQVVKSEAQLATSVSGLKAIQQDGVLGVSFNVPSELSGSRFVAEIAGLDGSVLSANRGRASSGKNQVNLALPKSGLYYVRVKVASQQTAGRVLVK